jgi:hypothetical protein
VLGRRKLAIQSLIVLAALACSGPSPAPGPLVGVTKAAAKTAPADIAFDAFIFDLNLQKTYGTRADEIQAQLRSSRAAVNAKVKPVHLVSYAARQGVLLASDPDVITPLLFASTLADALDPVTEGRTTGGQTPSAPLTSTSDGPTTTTTTFLNTTTQLFGSGSKVTLTMHWTYRETTVDKATGAKLVDLNDDRTMIGTIDVCPNASGVSPATIDVHIQLSASAGGGTKTRSSTSSNTFSGHVDDQAVLRRVTQDAQIQTSWQTDAGSGGYDLNLTNASWQASESGVGSGIDSNAVGGSLTPKGTATADQVTKEAGETIAIDSAAINPAYNQAQKLWRNGRCVVIQVPDYKAETPIQVEKQSETQHDEAVDPKSETKFSMSIKHRFGGALSQPAEASLTSGDKKLEPAQVYAVPASLKYTAPAEQDKRAVALLKSISKRGIGKLVIAFHTAGRHLKLDIKGKVRIEYGGVVEVAEETVGPVEFTKKDDTSYEGAASVRGFVRLIQFYGGSDTGPFLIPAGNDCFVSFDTGTLYLAAHIEEQGDTSVWLVHLLDDDRTNVNSTEGSCKYFRSGGTGGESFAMVQIPGDFRIPIDGGTVHLQGTQKDQYVTTSVDATVTATVTKS